MDRVVFLKRLAASFAHSATVLLIYGHVNPGAWNETLLNGDTWDWTNREVSRNFLGVDNLAEPTLHRVESQNGVGQQIAVFENGAHRAIWSRALSGQTVTNRYVASLRDLIALKNP